MNKVSITTIDFNNSFREKETVPIQTSIPTTGMLPDVFYDLGVVSADPNVIIAAATDLSIDHEWMLAFDTGSTAPASVTFPASVVFPDTPTWEANKHYEISIKYNSGLSSYFGLIQSWNFEASV